MRHLFRHLLLLVLCLPWLVSCSSSGDQFLKKLEAPAFVSELYGSDTQTLAISHDDVAHISWMGFIQSNNYSYFKITRVQVGSTVVVADGVEKDGAVFTASSNAIIKDVAVGAGSSGNNEFVDGSINVAGSGDLQITVKYSPLVAIETDNNPHEAYFILNYDSPKQGSLRLKLTGYTQGIKAEKCTQDPAAMTVTEYEVAGAAFDLYFCGKQVAVKGQANVTEHGASTNLASVPMTETTFTFYQPDDTTVCFLSSPTASIPDFVLPIPPGLAPIESMDITMTEGSYAECSLESGNIFCDANIQLDALVTLTGLTASNTGFTAEELVTSDCPDFGAISGAGTFGADSMTLIVMGKTLADMNTEEYGIIDSLIVGEIVLEK